MTASTVRGAASPAAEMDGGAMESVPVLRESACDVICEELHELKWLVLAVACFLTFGSYYTFDFPGSIGTGARHTIESRFRDHGVEYTQSMNQMLYSVYSWPNMVLALVGGILIDRYLGLRRSMLLFSSLILTGSVVFYIGVHNVTYPLLVAGRAVFGLGGESLSVAQSAFVARWFKGRRGMALAFGITISFSRVGSSFNFILSPLLASRYGVQWAAAAGVVACVLSLLACLLLVVADIYAVHTGYIQAEPIDVAPPAEAERTVDGEDVTEGGAATSTRGGMQFKDVLRLSWSYWFLCAICVACYAAIFPFVGIARNFFEVKYGYSSDRAAQYISAYQLTSAAASPAIGFVVDAVGRNTLWLMMASASFVAIHGLFAFTMIPAIVLMMSMGVCYSFLVSGLWPSIPCAVADNIVGLSYGMMTAVQNIGLAAFPMVVGVVLDRHTTSEGAFESDNSSAASPTNAGTLPSLQGYLWTEALFASAAAVAFLFSVALTIDDKRHLGILSASSSQRRVMLGAVGELLIVEPTENMSIESQRLLANDEL